MTKAKLKETLAPSCSSKRGMICRREEDKVYYEVSPEMIPTLPHRLILPATLNSFMTEENGREL